MKRLVATQASNSKKKEMNARSLTNLVIPRAENVIKSIADAPNGLVIKSPMHKQNKVFKLFSRGNCACLFVCCFSTS